MRSLEIDRKNSTRVAAVIFLTPAFIFLAVYIVYATINVFKLSLYNWNGITSTREFVALGNWKELLVDKYFSSAVSHNFIIVFMSLVVQMPIGMALAFMLDRLGRRAGPLKVIYYLPSLLSTAAVGLLFQFIYSARNGVFTTISQLFGGGIVDLLGSAQSSLMGVFTVICWTAIPFYMVFYLAALSGQSYEIYESSVIDGADLGQYFFKIALPMLWPSIKTACTLSMIGSLKYFDLIYIMTEGGPNYSSELMATYMYRMTFRFRRMGYGATIASGMFIIITIFSLIFLFVTSRRREES
jgi:raffinose/stachyose/melibiose transport system permease protein